MEYDTSKFSPEEKRKFVDNISKVEKACKDFRGEFIHAITDMECLIDHIIAMHFCNGDKEKITEMLCVLLTTDRITLQSKVQVMFFIIHKYYKNIYNINSPVNPKKGNYQTKKLEGRLEDLITLRNKFAHRQFSFTVEQVMNYDEFAQEISLNALVGKGGAIIDKLLPLNKKIMSNWLKEILEINQILIRVDMAIKGMPPAR